MCPISGQLEADKLHSRMDAPAGGSGAQEARIPLPRVSARPCAKPDILKAGSHHGWEEGKEKRRMYRLVASDLDETLIGVDHRISEKNRKAIEEARMRGVLFVPASGRGYETIQGTLDELGLRGRRGQYLISFNGGAITENKDNRLLHFEGISFEKARELFERSLGYGVCSHVYTKDTVYAHRLTEDEIRYLDGRMEVVPFEGDSIDFLKDEPLVKVLYCRPDYKYLRQVARDLEDITADMDVSYSAGRYLEFNHKGVNKGAGLLRLAQLLGIPPEQTMAIGDNYNDLAMIRAAGLGVGVANTPEEMKPQCDAVTEADFMHDAVAEAIQKYILDA